MTLADASAYFDRTDALDPDNGIVRFRCQLDVYDDSKRDAGAAYRRILSVASGIAVPPKRALRIFNQVWLVGAQQTDGLAEPHRTKYVLQAAAQKVSISRLPSFLSSSVDSACWAAVEWSKDTRELEVSSNVPQTYLAYLPLGTDARVHDVVWFSGRALLAMSRREQPSGYLVLSCMELDQVLPEVATVTPRTYQPSLGAFTEGQPINVNALKARWRSLYLYGSQADARYQEGDCSVVLPAGTAVDTATRLDLAGRLWQVVSSEMISGARVVHARPA